MKLIEKSEMEKLVEKGYIHNSSRGYIDKNGYVVGFYRTKNKMYIEDKYVNISRNLIQGK